MGRQEYRAIFNAITFISCLYAVIFITLAAAENYDELNLTKTAQSTQESSPSQPAPSQPARQPADAKQELTLSQPAEKIDLPTVEQPQEIYVLKKIDPNRIGTEVSYETFAGVKIPEKILKSPSIGVGQRIEIYNEPKPIDAYMIMAKEMQYIWSDFHRWRQNSVEMTHANYRSIIVPLAVRAYGTEFTVSDPNASKSDTQGQIRYTLDYRDVYREYYPKYPDLKASNWFQHDISIISMDKIDPIGWMYTSNIGYRFSNINQKSFDTLHNWDFHSSTEYRSTYYINQALAPNPRCELFAQGEYFKSNHYNCDWAYKPDHYLIAGELRLKSKDMKTSYTGRFSYSIDVYSPFSNIYEKYEISGRVGHDFNDRFKGYTMLKYALGHTNSQDNAWWAAPPGYAGGMPLPAPFDVTALALTWESRAQYRVYDKLWVQAGFDLSAGLNMSDFDNIGWLAGLEYYAPGVIRVDVGVRGNHFYNIDDFLPTVYFKVYFFM